MMSALVLALTAVSINYVLRMVYFIYDQWSIELSPLLQAMQMYPALLMGFQTLYQGSYMLKCLVYSPDKDTFDKRHQMQQQQLLDHIWLNFTFILHSFCIFIVIYFCTVEPSIRWEMVTGEVAYRLFAVFIFRRLLQKLEEFGKVDENQALKDGGNQAMYEQGKMVRPVEATTSNAGRNELVVDQVVMTRLVIDDATLTALMKQKLSKQERGHVIQPVEACENKDTLCKSEFVPPSISSSMKLQ